MVGLASNMVDVVMRFVTVRENGVEPGRELSTVT